MEFIDGVPGTRPDLMDEEGIDRTAVVGTGVQCYLRQIFELGYFHADPHEGNLFARPDGCVGFVDCGRVGWVSERNRARVFDLMLAFVEADDAAATDILASMISAGPQSDVVPLQRELAPVVDAYQKCGLDLDPRELLDTFLAVVREQGLQVPSKYAVLLTTLAALEGVAKELAPEYRLTETVAAYALSAVPDRFGPERLKKMAFRTLARYGHLLDDLPVGLSGPCDERARGDPRRGPTGRLRSPGRPVGRPRGPGLLHDAPGCVRRRVVCDRRPAAVESSGQRHGSGVARHRDGGHGLVDDRPALEPETPQWALSIRRR